MPDAVWLKRTLPKAEVAARSNNRQAQAELCAGGSGLAVLPRPLGDRDRRLVAFDIGVSPPGRDTYVAITATCGGWPACARCWMW